MEPAETASELVVRALEPAGRAPKPAGTIPALAGKLMKGDKKKKMKELGVPGMWWHHRSTYPAGPLPNNR